MASWTPDPTFYPSPKMAMEAPQEIKNPIHRLAILGPSIGNRFPRLLAGVAVGVFEKASQLLQGVLLTPEINNHGAAELVIFIGCLGGFSLKFDVFLAENLHIDLPLTRQHLVFGIFKLIGKTAVQILFL